MKIVSFNVNGLRSRLHQLHEIIIRFQPDIVGLQETKVHDEDFPKEHFLKYGYRTYCYGQKSHYGVALLTRHEVLNIKLGFSDENQTNENQIEQRRVIIAEIASKIGMITIINGYFPQGENINHPTKFINKKIFYKNFQNYVEKHYNSESLLLIMGDMNVSPSDLDVGLEKKNYNSWIKNGKCSFLPEERLWIKQLMTTLNLIDIYRHMYPKNNYRCYSWFSYRSNCCFKKNQGLRIDLLLTTHVLASLCTNIDIKYEIRAMKKPSDHAPIVAKFDI